MHTVEMAALIDAGCSEEDILGSGPVGPALSRTRTALIVAAGGAIGSLLRWIVILVEPVTTTPTLVEIPWATLTVNIVGCIALGVLTGALEARPTRRTWVQPFLGTGVCGGFTTMSTLILEGSALIGGGFPVLAVQYAAITLVGSICAIVVGLFIGTRLWAVIARVRRLARSLRRRGGAA